MFFILLNTDHNNLADIAKVECKEAMERLKNIAKTNQLSTYPLFNRHTDITV